MSTTSIYCCGRYFSLKLFPREFFHLSYLVTTKMSIQPLHNAGRLFTQRNKAFLWLLWNRNSITKKSLNKKIQRQMIIAGVFHFSMNAWNISFSTPLTGTSRMMKKHCWKGKVNVSTKNIVTDNEVHSTKGMGRALKGSLGESVPPKPSNHDCL